MEFKSLLAFLVTKFENIRSELSLHVHGVSMMTLFLLAVSAEFSSACMVFLAALSHSLSPAALRTLFINNVGNAKILLPTQIL